MTNRSNLNITALDFDDIKNSLKLYLKSQEQFKDYDFEGSGLNILLDVLAYNTHYNAFYANMVASEMFLDSCKVKESGISIAKHLDYIPKSYRSAIAIVNVEFLSLSEAIKTRIRNGTGYYISDKDKFTTRSADGKTLTFNAVGNYLVKYESNKYIAKNIEIKEGTYKTVTYIVNNLDENLRYIIPEENVDTTSFEVRLQKSLTDTDGITDIWQEVTDLNKLTSDSKVYFIQYKEGKYEIYFGDGILGKQPEDGNVLTIKYLLSSGVEGNNLGINDSETNPSFTYTVNNNTLVQLIKDENDDPTPSFGGATPETLNSIKYYAPRNYQAQERAVTSEDYRTLIAREYNEQAESVFVWGGEDNDPPIYGKVFISIKPINSKKFTQTEKLAIAKNIIKERNLISITPEIVDPDYLYLTINSTVLFDSAKTTMNTISLESYLKSIIINYGRTELEKFDRNFRYSKFSKKIDDADESILSNTTEIILQKRFEPRLNISSPYTINFDNSLFHPVEGYEPILTSSGFGYSYLGSEVDAYFDDDGYGNVRIYRLVDNSKVIINSNAGTIDYSTGKITLIAFNPTYFSPTSTSEIQLFVKPYKDDILSRRNLILIIDEDSINVTCNPETLRYDPYNASGSPFPDNTEN